MPSVFETPAELEKAVGRKLGESEWLTVTQERVDLFADATDDHQWIHVDVERAKDGPFGGTIAHGYLTLSMIPAFNNELINIETTGARLNYGLNKVRFPAPLKVESRIRIHVAVAEVKPLDGGAEAVYRLTYETEGEPKPCCVAELVFRYYR